MGEARYQVRPVLDHAVFTCGFRWKVVDTCDPAETLGVYRTKAKAHLVAGTMERCAMQDAEKWRRVNAERTAESRGVLDKLAERVPNVSLSIIGLGEGATVEWVGMFEPDGEDVYKEKRRAAVLAAVARFPNSSGKVDALVAEWEREFRAGRR